jgi:hypothetical protein
LSANCPPTCNPCACGSAGPEQRSWLNLRYLLWRIEDGPQPTPLATNGLLGLPTTSVLVGGTDLDFDTFTGLQANAGIWLNRFPCWGVYAGGFLTEQRSVESGAVSDAAGSPSIVRPFLDALTAMPSGLTVSSPGTFSGSLASTADAQLAGAEAGVIRNLVDNENWTINLLAGGRYLDLDEDLSIVQTTQRLDGGLIPFAGEAAPGILIEDRFHTRNQFYGGQIGTTAEYRWGAIVAGLASKLALGTNHQVIEISGLTSGVGAGGSVLGGFLAAPGGNAGRFSQNRFVVVPEIGGTLGWQVNRALRLQIGYDFLYINDVSRPGTQIDPVVNQRLVPSSPAFGSTSGPSSPTRTFQSESFFAHGVQFGVQVSH